jgi:hypothetical protein
MCRAIAAPHACAPHELAHFLQGRPVSINGQGGHSMVLSETDLLRAINGTSDLAAASLATRIVLNRLRVQARTEPAKLSVLVADLRAFIAKNPAASAELATL